MRATWVTPTSCVNGSTAASGSEPFTRSQVQPPCDPDRGAGRRATEILAGNGLDPWSTGTVLDTASIVAGRRDVGGTFSPARVSARPLVTRPPPSQCKAGDEGGGGTLRRVSLIRAARTRAREHDFHADGRLSARMSPTR